MMRGRETESKYRSYRTYKKQAESIESAYYNRLDEKKAAATAPATLATVGS